MALLAEVGLRSQPNAAPLQFWKAASLALEGSAGLYRRAASGVNDDGMKLILGVVEGFLSKRAQGEHMDSGFVDSSLGGTPLSRLSAAAQACLIMFLLFANEPQLAVDYARRAGETPQASSLTVRNARAWAELQAAETLEDAKRSIEYVDMESTPDPLMCPSSAAQYDTVAVLTRSLVLWRLQRFTESVQVLRASDSTRPIPSVAALFAFQEGNLTLALQLADIVLERSPTDAVAVIVRLISLLLTSHCSTAVTEAKAFTAVLAKLEPVAPGPFYLVGRLLAAYSQANSAVRAVALQYLSEAAKRAAQQPDLMRPCGSGLESRDASLLMEIAFLSLCSGDVQMAAKNIQQVRQLQSGTVSPVLLPSDNISLFHCQVMRLRRSDTAALDAVLKAVDGDMQGAFKQLAFAAELAVEQPDEAPAEASDDDLAAVAAEYGFNPALVRSSGPKARGARETLQACQTSLSLRMARVAVVRVQEARAGNALPPAGTEADWIDVRFSEAEKVVVDTTQALAKYGCTPLNCPSPVFALFAWLLSVILDSLPVSLVVDQSEMRGQKPLALACPDEKTQTALQSALSLVKNSNHFFMQLPQWRSLLVRAEIAGIDGTVGSTERLTTIVRGEGDDSPECPASTYVLLAAAATYRNDASMAQFWLNYAVSSAVAIRSTVSYLICSFWVHIQQFTDQGSSAQIDDIAGELEAQAGRPPARLLPDDVSLFLPEAWTMSGRAAQASALLMRLRLALRSPNYALTPALQSSITTAVTHNVAASVSAAHLLHQFPQKNDEQAKNLSSGVAALTAALTQALSVVPPKSPIGDSAMSALVALSQRGEPSTQSAALLAKRSPTRHNYTLLAMAELRQSNLDAAEAALRSAFNQPEQPHERIDQDIAGLDGAESDAALNVRMTAIFVQRQNHAAAESSLKEAIDLTRSSVSSPEGRAARRLLCQLYLRAGKRDLAIRQANKAIDDIGQVVQTQRLLQPGSQVPADTAVPILEDLSGFHIFLAEIDGGKHYAAALAIFDDLVLPGAARVGGALHAAALRHYAQIHFAVAQRLLSQPSPSSRDLSSAINSLNTVIRSDPNFAAAYELLGRAHLARGDVDACARVCREAQCAGVSNVALKSLSAEARCALNADDQAIHDLAALLHDSPHNENAILAMFRLCRKLGKLAEVRPFIESQVDQHDTTASAHQFTATDQAEIRALSPRLLFAAAIVDTGTGRTNAAAHKLLALRGDSDIGRLAYDWLVTLYLNPRLEPTFGCPQLNGHSGANKILDQLRAATSGDAAQRKAQERASSATLPDAAPNSELLTMRADVHNQLIDTRRGAEGVICILRDAGRMTSRLHNIIQAYQLVLDLQKQGTDQQAACLRALVVALLYQEAKLQWQEAVGDQKVPLMRGKDEAKNIVLEQIRALTPMLSSDGVPNIAVHYAAAVLYVHTKEAPSARNLLKAVCGGDTPEVHAGADEYWHILCHLLLAELYASSGKFDLAVKYLGAVKAVDQSRVALCELQGAVYEREGAFQNAVQLYREGWTMSSETDVGCGYKLAFNLLKSQSYTETVEVACRLLEIIPEDAESAREDIQKNLLNVAAEALLLG